MSNSILLLKQTLQYSVNGFLVLYFLLSQDADTCSKPFGMYFRNSSKSRVNKRIFYLYLTYIIFSVSHLSKNHHWFCLLHCFTRVQSLNAFVFELNHFTTRLHFYVSEKTIIIVVIIQIDLRRRKLLHCFLLNLWEILHNQHWFDSVEDSRLLTSMWKWL